MGIIPRKEKTSGAAATPASTPAPSPQTATAQAAAEVAAPIPGPAAEVSQGAVAVKPSGGMVVGVGRPVDVVKEMFHNALGQLQWNTLHRVQANQGNFLDLEQGKASIAQEIHLELMSYQANWQISPGTDDPDDIQYVRYSDDGKTTTQGEDCMEFLKGLKEANYDKAKLSERCVLAGRIIAIPSNPNHPMVGELIQIDLPNTSKQQYDRYRFKVSLDVREGKYDAAAAGLMKLKARTTTANKLTWTVVDFERLVMS